MDGNEIAEYLSLPVNREEVWQYGIVDMAELMGVPQQELPEEMAVVLLLSVSSGFVHAQPVVADEGDPAQQCVKAMLALAGEYTDPTRAGRIDCNDQQLADELRRQFEGSGTDVQYRATMREWNAAVSDMGDYFSSGADALLPSLRDVGCTDQQIVEFAEASAEFYRRRFWEVLDDTDLIEIETPKPPSNLRYAVVLGAGAQSYGLGFYGQSKDHYSLTAQQADPWELNLFSFTYDSPLEATSTDVELWEELGLPLETGEAFPEANVISSDGLRRPTPKEIGFLTFVLKGLAQTTEEELDTGRWTKPIQVSGKQKKCVFTIPNLLDPPDRAEWVKRGKMPDSRGHEIHFKRVQEFIDAHGEDMSLEELNEAINAQFTGVAADDYELPRNTPAERAEALCQDALGSFGRRRVLLAREALAEDPDHVEARILLAESTHGAGQRVELFRDAQKIAAAALGDDMKELAGEFWGHHETRPYMRACEGLAMSLAEAGQLNDAIEQCREMLRLNPNDNQGIRYRIVPLFLEQNRDEEAAAVLEEYAEPTAIWRYSQALVEFRRNGKSAAVRRALRAAFEANRHVPELLQADEPPPMPETYALGSPEEAAMCVDELVSVLEETDGFLEWMFKEFSSWERDRTKRRRSKSQKKKRKKKR